MKIAIKYNEDGSRMYTNLNIDKLEVVEAIFHHLQNLKKEEFKATREQIWKIVSDYEKLFINRVCKDYPVEYRWTLPFVGVFSEKKASYKVIDKFERYRIKKYQYFRTTFNNIFKSL